MQFVETRIFTKRITEILSDDEYCEVQIELIGNPEKGMLMPGGKGLRKMRWAGSSRGKRGGLRFIYYVQSKANEILMLYVYKKNEIGDITKQQLKGLIQLVEEKYP